MSHRQRSDRCSRRIQSRSWQGPREAVEAKGAQAGIGIGGGKAMGSTRDIRQLHVPLPPHRQPGPASPSITIVECHRSTPLPRLPCAYAPLRATIPSPHPLQTRLSNVAGRPHCPAFASSPFASSREVFTGLRGFRARPRRSEGFKGWFPCNASTAPSSLRLRASAGITPSAGSTPHCPSCARGLSRNPTQRSVREPPSQWDH